ncbi:MAG: LD-carboxypeptidase [Deltaproteobacteria bacterium]|jgi:muramoyltetrapeptide carboxypeptidase|nr:LD-carboxypeptidase [Deltaproteobacteria bacterium]
MSERGYFLKPGATLGLFFPSSHMPLQEIDRLVGALTDWEFNIKIPVPWPRPKGYLASSDAERLASLRDLMTDPKVDALLAIRGGYGSLRLLPALAPLWKLYPQKPIIGFSDITALHMARWAATKVGGWHGPNLKDLDQPGARQRLAKALCGQLEPWKINKPARLKYGLAQGPLIGGNMSLVSSLIGSPYFPELSGAILLLEDNNEELYRLDRLLTSLKHRGVFQKVGGVIFGDLGQGIAPLLLKPLLKEVAEVAKGPVAWVPFFGHILQNQPWPVGALATLALTKISGELTFNQPQSLA